MSRGRPDIGDFSEFFRSEYALVVAFLRKTGFDWHLADEVTEQAMTLAYTRWSTITTSPRGWVRTTAYRLALKGVNAERTKLTRLVSKGYVTLVEAGEPHVDVDEQDLLLRTLNLLSPRQQLVMAWHLDGFTIDEIATSTQIRPATVRSNLRHARESLRKILGGRESGGTET